MNYYLIDGRMRVSSELYHHGVKEMHWGVRRYQNEDGTLTELGRQRLRGYDGEESYDFSENFRKADLYASKWEKKYGSTPINRLRFDYSGDDTINRGERYCNDYDWNRTSLDDIYDSYREYRDSEEWD